MYIFKYQIPESFYDETILSYLINREQENVNELLDDIDNSKRNIAMNKNIKYHKDRLYYYSEPWLEKHLTKLNKWKSKYRWKFVNKSERKMISADEIKENVKCWDILGKPERADNNRLWYKIRNERTASCCVYKDTNSFYDFGSTKGGSVIDLYMLIHDCDFKTAMSELTQYI